MARPTALQVYKHLPIKNCGRCGENTCMAYAIKLAEGVRKIDDCPPLSDEQKKKLIELLTPAVRAVEIGTGKEAIKVGGEEVSYRHELRFFNQTALFIEVSDAMTGREVDDRINYVKGFETERLGHKLKLDGIGIRCVSQDIKKYKDLVQKTAKAFTGPLILCSDDMKAIKAGVEIVKKRRPLLYAATPKNLKEALNIAREHDAPLALRSPDMKELGLMAKAASSKGIEDIVLDPIAGFGPHLGETLNRYAMLRKAAVSGLREYGHPLMAKTFFMREECIDKEKCAYDESSLASMLIDRFASILLMHSIEPWTILPILTFRDGLYTDPRIEPTVEPKLYPLVNAGKDSPVILTTNFALTYHSVSKDLEGAKIPSHLLVVDTNGLAVSVAVAADKLTPQLVKEALEKNKVAGKVSHKTLIIPGVAGRLKDEIRELTGWKVIVGPQDSSQLAAFLKENHGKKEA
jgi:acetyl-CoA decarbonylase/synthase complex subunit gamma